MSRRPIGRLLCNPKCLYLAFKSSTMHELPKRISNPKKFSITKHETEYKGKDLNKDKAQSILDLKSKKLAELQEVFYADGRWSLLIILQGMDGSGKDSC